jgi:hypothetical protein
MTIHYIVSFFHHVLLLMAVLCYCIRYLSSLWSVEWGSNVCYVSEYTAHCLKLSEEHKLFESKMLRIIFNHKQEEVT